MMKAILGLGAALAMGGCVAATPLAVAPGQGKSYADLQRDDAACRGTPVAATTATAGAQMSIPQATGAQATVGAPDYYQCMAAHGELVTGGTAAAYPAYAAYPYPAYGYPYAYDVGYPYDGYPYVGYPYSSAFAGPFVGVGLGFGFGGYYHGGFYRGGYEHHGFEHGGFEHGGFEHGGFEHGGFEHGGYHGGGFGHGGGFRH